MNFGFNSNVIVGDTTYHVQSEDRGPSHPFVDTVVYQSGRVVHKVSTEYRKMIGGTQPEAVAKQLHELLSKQHRSVVAELESGNLELTTITGVPAQDRSPVLREGITVRLLNPKTWLNNGEAILQIELVQKDSKDPVTDAEVESFLEADKQRSVRTAARSDAAGKATLNFRLPVTVAEETSLVIRATDGLLYGELRFRLKAKRPEPATAGPAQ
jgi:hypothetical protein